MKFNKNLGLVLFLVNITVLAQNASVEPITNACGPEGALALLIPEGPNSIFKRTCDDHDLCYYSSSKTQSQCDDIFLNDLMASCTVAFANDADKLRQCVSLAGFYVSMVENYGEAYFYACIKKVINCYQINQFSHSVSGIAKMEVRSAVRFGDEFQACVTIFNIANFNTHFKLILFPARERSKGELPEGDLFIAWYPLLTQEFLFVRAGEQKEICLDTGGFIGLARNAGMLGDAFTLELWVNSLNPEIGLKLADAIQAKMPTN